MDQRDRSICAQNAANVAGAIIAAGIASGGLSFPDALPAFEGLRGGIYEGTCKLAGEPYPSPRPAQQPTPASASQPASGWPVGTQMPPAAPQATNDEPQFCTEKQAKMLWAKAQNAGVDLKAVVSAVTQGRTSDNHKVYGSEVDQLVTTIGEWASA